MTFLEKLKIEHPDKYDVEMELPFEGINVEGCPCNYGYEEPQESKCDISCFDCWHREIPTDESSSVNHPKHYNRENGMECIDEMVAVFGKDMVKTFCLLNVWKYRFRASDKNGAEDLDKSDWYMKKFIELGDWNDKFKG